MLFQNVTVQPFQLLNRCLASLKHPCANPYHEFYNILISNHLALVFSNNLVFFCSHLQLKTIILVKKCLVLYNLVVDKHICLHVTLPSNDLAIVLQQLEVLILTFLQMPHQEIPIGV